MAGLYRASAATYPAQVEYPEFYDRMGDPLSFEEFSAGYRKTQALAAAAIFGGDAATLGYLKGVHERTARDNASYDNQAAHYYDDIVSRSAPGVLLVNRVWPVFEAW